MAKLWDVVAAMHTLAGKAPPPQARSQDGEGGEGEGEGEQRKQEDPRVCTSDLTKVTPQDCRAIPLHNSIPDPWFMTFSFWELMYTAFNHNGCPGSAF